MGVDVFHNQRTGQAQFLVDPNMCSRSTHCSKAMGYVTLLDRKSLEESFFPLRCMVSFFPLRLVMEQAMPYTRSENRPVVPLVMIMSRTSHWYRAPIWWTHGSAVTKKRRHYIVLALPLPAPSSTTFTSFVYHVEDNHVTFVVR